MADAYADAGADARRAARRCSAPRASAPTWSRCSTRPSSATPAAPTLAFAPMTWDDGRLELGESVDLERRPCGSTTRSGGPRSGATRSTDAGFLRMRNATFAPSWSVSGEELLRAWQRATGVDYDGVLAVDVVTLVAAVRGDRSGRRPRLRGAHRGQPGARPWSAATTHYYPDPSVQDELNAGLDPRLQGQAVRGRRLRRQGEGPGTGGRRPAPRDLLPRRRRAGRIRARSASTATSPRRPVTTSASFTQNTNGSKVDYWQRRSVTWTDHPRRPTARPATGWSVVDRQRHPAVRRRRSPTPQSGYFTRWAGMFLSTFLPDGAQMRAGLPRR